MYSPPMANQIVLSWKVNVANTTFGPAQAAAALSAVPLYLDTTTDPVLGQLFGLTVASDSTATGTTTATRTLTLNMTASSTRKAPPPFPCHPITSTPPVLPYPLRKTTTLPGSFFVTNGSTVVPTTESQLPSLVINDFIQFLSQQGVFYKITSVGATSIGITPAYTGVTGNTGAFKEVAAPAVLAAFYSTSPLDTNGVSITPVIPPGPGANVVLLTYKDSTGAGPFTAKVFLTGKFPAVITLHAGSIDIAEIDEIVVTNTGSFGNSVGQITLVELSSALPSLPANPTPIDFARITDAGQMLISRHLAYLPPSFFSLAQQGASMPQLAGDFIVTTGSTNVPTTVDQTSVLSQGDVIQFAEQMTLNTTFGTIPVYYTVAAVTAKLVQLTTPFTGIDNNNTGTNQAGVNSNAGTKGNLGSKLNGKATGALLVTPSAAAPPTSAELSAPLGQFVAPEVAAPPPNPPLSPSTVSAPTFLSDLFTQTLQLALAVPVVPQTITFV